MKRNYRGVLAMCLVLFANLCFTQYTVNMYYAQRYEAAIACAVLNVLLFPVAIFIYRKDKQERGGTPR